MKTLSKTRLSKKEREKKVLFGLVDAYIKNPQPIGSKTLKESLFQDLSSATIRNYFSSLEEAGYLAQQHASGGRSPTSLAYETYATEYLRDGTLDQAKDEALKALSQMEAKEIGAFLQNAAEVLSELSGYPVFISSPRFDQDSITDIKLLGIGDARVLCVIVTELGLIRTETLYLKGKPQYHALRRIEEVLLSRIKSTETKITLDEQEETLAQKIYNEIMVRYIIGYANFSTEDIYKTGLSRLLAYPEFNNAETFASGLSLFENENHLKILLKDSCRDKTLKVQIGEALKVYSPLSDKCSVLILPYSIGGKIVGAVGLLGPERMPYRTLFGLLRAHSEYLSLALSQSIDKHKLTYRLPQDGTLYLEAKTETNLLEDQTSRGNL